ncbi:hypothetical protein B0H16DRAFT_1889277 [Mycena metata]|uniref:F-box domain-containing protein n=1 Tax=Mycena metata TaxID=1033252 RepID=A0AAD7N4W7_9AGAR|nr:hypothetical protein B0H16DRAFT_1889277 [Mycena metata]
MSQNMCHLLCPEHCGPAKIFELNPRSPYPELLLNNAVPYDFQAQEIEKTIGSVDEHIAALSGEIKRLRRLMDALIAQRTDLERFAHHHRGVVSIIRRLPADILSEIFSHHVGSNMSFTNPTDVVLEPILQVSRGWRDIALTRPYLWRHFFVQRKPSETRHRVEMDLSKISQQLRRSGQSPLSLTLDICDEQYPIEVLQLFLAEAIRWREANLTFSSRHLAHLLTSTGAFPALKKLSIHDGSPQHAGSHATDVRLFFDTLEGPAIEELALEVHVSRLAFPWPRLHKLALHSCQVNELLHILPLLSPGAWVSCTFGGSSRDQSRGDLSSTKAQSPIHALELHRCPESFVAEVLTSLTAPSLAELTITPFTEGACTITSDIIAFLSRSACTLTCLCLHLRISDTNLLKILRSPHVHKIASLDIGDHMVTPVTGAFFEALTTDDDLIPNLHTIAIQFPAFLRVPDAPLRAMLASRHPVLHSLRMTSRRGRTVLSPADIEALGAKGMEVVIFEQFR